MDIVVGGKKKETKRPEVQKIKLTRPWKDFKERPILEMAF
jgi:hypothetical protein